MQHPTAEAGVPDVLTVRTLNRALLARQLLLERASLDVPDALEQMGGIQAQYAPSAYVGLWTRLAAFERDGLTQALQDRRVIQGTLMRSTIHVVARSDYWPFAEGTREARRAWFERVDRSLGDDTRRAETQLRAALADGPREARELGELGTGFLGRLSVWVDLVRVPPSGTWERRRAERLALATWWLGPSDRTPDEGRRHLVGAYLRAFGPAAWRDIASWAGLAVAEVRAAAASLELRRFRDEEGRELVDLPGQPLPPPETPAPVRFLPHWDACLLVHARRTGILPEVHRPRVFSSRNPFSVGTVLIDGRVVAAWSYRDGRILVDAFEELEAADGQALEEERQALEAFHA